MKIIEITNVDFSLRQFLLPLMRAMRARGHEVIGVCAEGPLLDGPRAEGFRDRGAAAGAQRLAAGALAGIPALCGCFAPNGRTWCTRTCRSAGSLRGMAAWWAGVPRIAYTCHGFWFNYPGSWPRAAAGFAMEWLGGRVTDVFLTVSEAEAADARRLHIHRERRRRSATAAIRRAFSPIRAARQRIRARTRRAGRSRWWSLAVSRLVWHKGYPELAAAMRTVPDAELWVAGERLTSDRGRRHGGAAARRRPWRPAAPAGLSRRRRRS